ncbi:hypothetical protein MXB_3614 [Myxobolus squamalis]|nr:hypothetical protein MXB_3614 [Myxobolus squamalis]
MECSYYQRPGADWKNK